MSNLSTLQDLVAPALGVKGTCFRLTHQWTPLTSPPAPYSGLEGQTAVSDPNTGLIYVIGGFWNLDGKLPTTIGINNFLTVIDPTQSTGTRIVSQTPATGMNNLTGAVALTSGSSVPGGRLDACAAATDDGSQIIVFGGELNIQSFLSSIYVLNVATQVWRRGPDVATPRSQSACAYHDGYFVVFGGTGSRNMSEDMHTTQPLVFNVETLLWVLQFTPKEAPPGNGSGGNSTVDNGDGRNKGKSNIGLIVACAFGGFMALVGIMVAVILNRKAHHRRRRDIFKTATDKHTKRPDVTNVVPREAAAFIHHSGGGAGAEGRRSGVNDSDDDDEHDFPPFHRPRNPPTNTHPYKPFTPSEFYPSTYGNKPTTTTATAATVAGATASKVSTPTNYGLTDFGYTPIIATEAAATTNGAPLMAAAGATSSRPVSSSSRPASTSSRPASFTTTAVQSDPSFCYKQIQTEMDKPHSKSPSPLPPPVPRTSTFVPRTSYTPSSPTDSDQTDSTILGYVSTMISPPVRPAVGLPPPIPRRPPSGAGYYSMASVGDTRAPVVAASANQQQQQQRPPSPSTQAPQYRGDEHAHYQPQLYQSQQQHQYPYYSQYQRQKPYQQSNSIQGYIQEQPQHSTSSSTAAEEAETQPPHPATDENKAFHGTWTNDRRRHVAPHAVREVPVEKYRDYKVEAPRQPQTGQGSFH
ncbi:hypothetical protein BGZ97_008831 [Linnemannia gamsii]|uniref:Galactose oxidase n=1 Tax=Linnemannia gamsii TaxID=64522 RepID=A0A9P6RP52_9FUNG|nr:hypothetical protein BGZ97_008831 [Linnemannia gamsii]